MIVVMERGATEENIQNVIDKFIVLEFSVHRSTGVVHTVLGGVGPAERGGRAVVERVAAEPRATVRGSRARVRGARGHASDPRVAVRRAGR